MEEKPKCSFGGCSKERKTKGLCVGHYKQLREGRELVPLRPYYKELVPSGSKRCSRCGEVKSTDHFNRSANRKDGLHGHCRNCANSGVRASRYGLTSESFLQKLKEQANVCPICECDPGENGWRVDHDHSCCPGDGKTCGRCVRQILCRKCNLLVGYLERYERLLPKAQAYIEGHSSARSILSDME